MAEKTYEVIARKYTGKHKVYKKGDKIPESEIFGSKDIAIVGVKAFKKAEREYPEVKPVLKTVSVGKISKEVKK